MSSPYRALAAFYAAGSSEGCYECGRSISPTNPRRGAWCAACEMVEVPVRNIAAGEPKRVANDR